MEGHYSFEQNNLLVQELVDMKRLTQVFVGKQVELGDDIDRKRSMLTTIRLDSDKSKNENELFRERSSNILLTIQEKDDVRVRVLELEQEFENKCKSTDFG